MQAAAVAFGPLLDATTAMKMPSFEATEVAGRSVAESEFKRYLAAPALLNIPRPVRSGMQALAALATINALSCFASPGSTGILPLVIGESDDAIWVTFHGEGIYGEPIAAIMLRVYALLEDAGISATYEKRTIIEDTVKRALPQLPALAITIVGINTATMPPEQDSALSRALREVAGFIFERNAAFVWSTNDRAGKHHAQMAVVSHAGSGHVTLAITDPHGCTADSCTTQTPHMPCTRLASSLLQCGMSFRLDASPRLQSQEESCVPWAVALVLARSIRPATRKSQMWLVSLVSVLYKLYTCTERAPPQSSPRTKKRATESRSESSKSSKTAALSSVRGPSTTTKTTVSTDSTFSRSTVSETGAGSRTTTTSTSVTSVTTETAIVLSSDSDSDSDSDARRREAPRVTTFGLDESGGTFVWSSN